MRSLLAALALVAVLAGCGGTTEVREPPLQSTGEAPTTQPGPAGAEDDDLRIWVVTHGQAASPFWAIVRNGVEAAAREMDVPVSYRAPDIYSLERMRRLIDAAIASRPAGLVVSLPERAIRSSVRKAVQEGIPVVTINSGADRYRGLGVLAHVGQPERRAGLQAGRRLARAGARTALCVNLEIPNQGLDARCRGLERAMREVGGRSRVIRVDDQNPAAGATIAAAVRERGFDAVLALNSTGGLLAIDGLASLPPSQRPVVATFDLGPEVLTAVRDGRLAFAVDQQAYLQGFLPVVLLVQRARYGLFPAGRELIATGPNFVTRSNARRVLELSRRSIR